MTIIRADKGEGTEFQLGTQNRVNDLYQHVSVYLEDKREQVFSSVSPKAGTSGFSECKTVECRHEI